MTGASESLNSLKTTTPFASHPMWDFFFYIAKIPTICYVKFVFFFSFLFLEEVRSFAYSFLETFMKNWRVFSLILDWICISFVYDSVIGWEISVGTCHCSCISVLSASYEFFHFYLFILFFYFLFLCFEKQNDFLGHLQPIFSFSIPKCSKCHIKQ